MNFLRIYKNNSFIRNEMSCSLGEFISMKRLELVQKIILVEPDDSRFNPFTLYVGNCTPNMRPIEDGDGWDYSSNICKKRVLEVHTYEN